jgi:hypothetical protein
MGEIYEQSTNSDLEGNTRVITFVFKTIHTLSTVYLLVSLFSLFFLRWYKKLCDVYHDTLDSVF